MIHPLIGAAVLVVWGGVMLASGYTLAAALTFSAAVFVVWLWKAPVK